MGGALALGLVVASPASAATELDWELQYELDEAEGNRIDDVDAAAVDSVWAVGRIGEWDTGTPLALHYDGDSWKEVETDQGSNVTFRDVDATSSGSAWVTVDDVDSEGARDAVMHYDDGWDTHEFPGSVGGDVAALSDEDVWYVAGKAGSGAVAQHYDGTKWTATELPGDDVGISSVQARATDDVWAVGSDGQQPYAAHWDGSSWQVISPDDFVPPEGEDEWGAWLTDVAFVDGKVWAVGLATGDTFAEGLFYKFDGTAWKAKKLPDIEYGVGAEDAGEGPDGSLWLSNGDSDIVYRKTESGWAEVTVPEENGAPTGVEEFTVADGKVWVAGTSELSDFEYHGLIFQGS